MRLLHMKHTGSTRLSALNGRLVSEYSRCDAMRIFLLTFSISFYNVVSLSVSTRWLTIHSVCSSMLTYGISGHAHEQLPTDMREDCYVMLWGWWCLLLQFQLLSFIISFFGVGGSTHKLNNTRGGASEMLLAFNKNMKKRKFFLLLFYFILFFYVNCLY